MQANLAFAPELRRRARAFVETGSVSTSEAINQQALLDRPSYDVFLSQPIKGKEVVLGIYATLVEDIGLAVFCDWLEEPKNAHAITTPREAAHLRH